MDKLYSVSGAGATPDLPEEAKGRWEVYPVYGVDDDGVCLCSEREACPYPGKHPTTPNGFNDASSDPLEIARLWTRWPGDNVGLKTGVGSRVAGLDWDEWEGGGRSRVLLQETHGPLPPTMVHQTGSGAVRDLFAVPAHLEGLPSKTLAPGLELKADGAGIVIPPSRTDRGEYLVLIDRPLAPLPDWIVRLATSLAVHEGGKDRATRSRYRLPGKIREGTRALTLYRYGCSLRAHGHDLDAIFEGLLRTNRERCVPPLGEAEVRKAARSAARHERGNATTATPEALEALAGIEAHVVSRAWPGAGGRSERSVMVALVLVARAHGTLIPAGVRVGIDTRSLAERAKVSHPTALAAVGRLRRSGLVRRDDLGRRPADAGALVLVAEAIARGARANLYHSTTPPTPLGNSTDPMNGQTLRAPRLRWGGSLGKGCEAVVDALERAGGEMEMGDLAGAVGVKRKRDLRSRAVARLEEAGLVQVEEETVRLRDGWLAALDRERFVSGEKKAENLQRAEHERQREAYRMWKKEEE